MATIIGGMSFQGLKRMIRLPRDLGGGQVLRTIPLSQLGKFALALAYSCTIHWPQGESDTAHPTAPSSAVI
jgi:hypothetical protein